MQGTLDRTPPETRSNTMQAIVQNEYGSADVLSLRTVAVPTPGPGEVLIEVAAAGVDRGVWHLMTGLPYLVRIAGFGLMRPKTPVLGLDVAGRVVATGAGTTRFQVGDEVFGIGSGTYAEFATANEDKLARKPANITSEQAAVSAISGITALEGLTDVGQLIAGQRVLIIGASGGVGTFAVSIAKALGARVTGVCGPSMLERVRALGAMRVLDYTREDLAAEGERYDLILDIGGRNSIARLRSVLQPNGTLVIVGGEGGGAVTGGVGRQLGALLLSPFLGQRLTSFISTEHFTTIERLAVFLESGAVVPEIGERYRLAEVPDAIRRLESKPARGKSVIVVRER